MGCWRPFLTKSDGVRVPPRLKGIARNGVRFSCGEKSDGEESKGKLLMSGEGGTRMDPILYALAAELTVWVKREWRLLRRELNWLREELQLGISLHAT